MVIEKINIINFGKLSDFTLELADGINIIEGKNESGKSTISAFIKFMFYGLPSEPEKRERCVSWHSGTASGTLTFRTSADRYRIEREAVTVRSSEGKPTYRERCVVVNEETGKPLYKGKVPGEVFLGIPAGVFESTAFIGQLEGSAAGGRTLAEATENILFSADETVNTKKALKKLDEARVHLYHKNRKGGKIYEYTQKRAELAEALTEAQQTSAEIISSEGTLNTFKDAREKSISELEKAEGELSAYERYLIKKNCLELNTEKAKKQAAEEELKKLSAANRYGAGISDEDFIKNLENDKIQIISLETGLQSAQKELEKSDNRLKAIKAPLEAQHIESTCEELLNGEAKLSKRSTICKNTAIICAILALPCALLAIVSILLAVSAAACFILLSGTFAVCAFLAKKHLREDYYSVFRCSSRDDFLSAVSKRKHALAEIAFTERARKETAERASQIKSHLDNKKASVRKTLKAAGFGVSASIIDDINKAKDDARGSLEKRQTAASAKAAADVRIRDILAALSDVSVEEREKALAEEFNEDEMKAFDVRGKKREQDFLSKSVSAQTERIHAIECELASLYALHAKPAEIAQSINALHGKIEELSEKFEAYMLAIDAINAASGKLRDGISPQIAKSASKIMESLSCGKYPTVFVDADFALSYSDGGITRDVQSLSAGTSDIVYISLRIALANTLCKNELPPFVFDESFTRLDDSRLLAALGMLESTFANCSQAIIFTCHGRESELAKNAIKSTLLSI